MQHSERSCYIFVQALHGLQYNYVPSAQNLSLRPQAVTVQHTALYAQIMPSGAANELFCNSEATAHLHHLLGERQRWEEAFYFQS